MVTMLVLENLVFFDELLSKMKEVREVNERCRVETSVIIETVLSGNCESNDRIESILTMDSNDLGNEMPWWS